MRMPGQFVPSPKNRRLRRGGSRVSRAGREESGPLSDPRQIPVRAMYKTPPRTSSAPSPIRNILAFQFIATTTEPGFKRMPAPSPNKRDGPSAGLPVICLPQSLACQRSLVEVRPTIPVCTQVGSVGLCVRLGFVRCIKPLAHLAMRQTLRGLMVVQTTLVRSREHAPTAARFKSDFRLDV